MSQECGRRRNISGRLSLFSQDALPAGASPGPGPERPQPGLPPGQADRLRPEDLLPAQPGLRFSQRGALALRPGLRPGHGSARRRRKHPEGPELGDGLLPAR